MLTELLLHNDFFYDEGTLSECEKELLARRITETASGVSEMELPSSVLSLLPVQRYKERYYHCYRSLPQLLSQTYSGLDTIRRDELTTADVIYSQADLFSALGLSMTKENVMNYIC
jgi:hypothetical protein